MPELWAPDLHPVLFLDRQRLCCDMGREVLEYAGDYFVETSPLSRRFPLMFGWPESRRLYVVGNCREGGHGRRNLTSLKLAHTESWIR